MTSTTHLFDPGHPASYRILDPKKVTDKTDPRDDCEHIMSNLPQFENMYQYGHTKVEHGEEP